MTPGAVLLALALVAGGASLLGPAHLRKLLHRIHVGAALASLALLTAAFLAADLSYAYVWAHTTTDTPWAYRLSGVWGGEEGTILLWAAVVAVASLLVARREGDLHARAGRALVVVSTALAGVALLVGAFDATGDELRGAPSGRGLAEVLLTPLMVVHPPVQFVAYGLIAVPAAFAVAAWLGPRNDDAWVEAALPWARVAWLFATLGLGLGALWAYYVLSFGGYWAWDPVETANLLPWLALTAFLHAAKPKLPLSGALLAFAAFVLTLFATFSTRSGLWVSVHAFTDPTNRFVPDAPARMLAIVDAHLPSRLFLGLATAALLAGVALALAHHARDAWQRYYAAGLMGAAGVALFAPGFVWGALFATGAVAGAPAIGAGIALALALAAPLVVLETRAAPAGRAWFTQARLLPVAALLLTLALGVALLLDLQSVDGPQRRLFDQRAPFVALPIVSLLTLTLALPLGKRRAIGLTAMGAITGIVLAWATPGARVLALATPFLLAAIAAALVRLLPATAPRARSAPWLLAALVLLWLGSNPPTHWGASPLVSAGAAPWWGALLLALGLAALVGFVRSRPRHERRLVGVWVVHLGLAVGLLGYAGSTYAQEREVFAAHAIGGDAVVADHELRVGSATATSSAGGVDRVVVPVEVLRDGAPEGVTSLAFRWSPEGQTYRGELVVRRGLTQDLYLTPLAFHTSEGWVGADAAATGRARSGDVDMVTFSASVLPLVGLVWMGLWTMLAGILLVVGQASSERRASAVA